MYLKFIQNWCRPIRFDPIDPSQLHIQLEFWSSLINYAPNYYLHNIMAVQQSVSQQLRCPSGRHVIHGGDGRGGGAHSWTAGAAAVSVVARAAMAPLLLQVLLHPRQSVADCRTHGDSSTVKPLACQSIPLLPSDFNFLSSISISISILIAHIVTTQCCCSCSVYSDKDCRATSSDQLWNARLSRIACTTTTISIRFVPFSF